MTTRRFAALLLLVTLAGCATTRTTAVRIDGSSPAAFDASWKALQATLNPEQQAQLNTAIVQIGATKIVKAAMQEPSKEPPTSFGPQTLRSDLDGMTYDEIIKAGAATGTKIVDDEQHDGPQNAPDGAPQKAPVAASK
jgi:hypothetical protein